MTDVAPPERRGHLVIVSSEFPPGPGGIGNHAFHLARELIALGWHVTVVTQQDYTSGTEVRAFNDRQRFEIHPLGRYGSRAAAAVARGGTVLRQLRRARPDAVIASGLQSVLLSAAACRVLGVPCVAVAHGSEFGSGRTGATTRRAYEAADVVIAVSQFTRERMRDHGIRARRVEVIGNGADGRAFAPSVADGERVRAQLDVRGHVLLTVGNVTERKGQADVVLALPRVVDAVGHVTYLAAGLPTDAEKVMHLARELGVADHVRLLGPVPQEDLAATYNACDVFVMLSRATATGDVEGFGIAVVEAALCAKPAVVTSGSGLIEAIVDGTTGRAVPPGDAAAAADTIIELLADQPLRERMGNAARGHAQRHQTWQHRAEQYEGVVEATIARRRSPARAPASDGPA